MLIPSDISDTSDWEWIAGGFPCRDVARERFFSVSCWTQIQNGISLNSSLPKNNIKTEILEDNTIQAGDQIGDQTVECPISSIPAGRNPTSCDQSVTPKAEDTANSKLTELQDKSSNPTEKDTPSDFPVYEIVDSAVPSNKPGNDPPIIRRSCRNVEPPYCGPIIHQRALWFAIVSNSTSKEFFCFDMSLHYSYQFSINSWTVFSVIFENLDSNENVTEHFMGIFSD